MIAIGALLFVRYLPLRSEVIAGDPTFTEYEENATSFFLIMWMDVGIFVPLTIARETVRSVEQKIIRKDV